MPTILSAIGPLLNQGSRRVSGRFLSSTRALGRLLDIRMEGLIGGWASVLLIAACLKVVSANRLPASLLEALFMALPFVALGAAPVLGYRLAAGAYPKGSMSEQPALRFARYGSWRAANPLERRHARMSGPAGFLVSLIVGVLLNVPYRTFKFLLIVPAAAPTDPAWGQLFVLCFTAQGVVLNFLYMTCFVMGLRSIPLFPRMLVFVWIADIASQFAMAEALGRIGMPSGLGPLLVQSLYENVVHVIVAIALWLPYLIVSDQVNLRFRARMRLERR